MLSRESDADGYTRARLDYHATVRELPSNERPRERLEHFGPQALALAELLAIILRTGSRGDNARTGDCPGWCGPTSASCAPSTVWARPSRPR